MSWEGVLTKQREKDIWVEHWKWRKGKDRLRKEGGVYIHRGEISMDYSCLEWGMGDREA